MIRIATLKDIPALLELENSSFKGEDRFSREQFRYAITRGHSYFRVYQNDYCGIVGYVYMLGYGMNNGRLYSLAAYPGNGIGRILLKDAEFFCYNPNYPTTIKLEVKKGNNKAINFYIKHGYKPYGIKHNYYKDGKAAILMKKELSDHAKGRMA